MDLYNNRALAAKQVWNILLNKANDKYPGPLSAQQIGDKLNLSAGQVIDLVEELRFRGHMICGFDETGGFWLGTLAEMLKTIEHLEDKIERDKYTVDKWKHNADRKELYNQMEMHI